MRCVCGILGVHFYPRPPRGGRLKFQSFFVYRVIISIHALREEGDRFPPCLQRRRSAFLSTPSARRATRHLLQFPPGPQNFYPRPPRGGRLRHLPQRVSGDSISIHALREEGDTDLKRRQTVRESFLSTPSARRATVWLAAADRHCAISIHALREEGDASAQARAVGISQFLSTPSARRATGAGEAARLRARDFYPRPPRGGRRYAPFRLHSPFHISIHALREEGDGWLRATEVTHNTFLSTPSARRATSHFMTLPHNVSYFYPRPPRGGRPAR